MKATVVQCLIELPDRATIGDTYPVTGNIRIVGLEAERIDVTQYGDVTDIAIGETTATLFARLRLAHAVAIGYEHGLLGHKPGEPTA